MTDTLPIGEVHRGYERDSVEGAPHESDSDDIVCEDEKPQPKPLLLAEGVHLFPLTPLLEMARERIGQGSPAPHDSCEV